MSSNEETEKKSSSLTKDMTRESTATSGPIVTTQTKQNRRKSVSASAVLLVVVAIFGSAVLLLFLQRQRSAEGRPVPSPRNVSFDGSNNNSNTGPGGGEATITLSPEQVARTGIKIETVGEKLSSAGAGTLATGVVQPNSYRETPVISLVGGIVRKMDAQLGQKVRRGQTVAVVFSEELSIAQSNYLKALAELDEHHKHHHRTTKLVEIGAESREELERATSKLKAAESEVASLHQKLLLLGLSQQRIDTLSSAKQVSSEIAVPSPASGTITGRSVNQGEILEANKELLRVTDLSSVWVVGQVYEKDLGHIRVGSGANITSDAYPGKIFRGQISYVDPRLDPTTRTAQVRVELANPGEMLKIGMFVNVAFATITGAENATPIVPLAAVQHINNQQVIFIATDKTNVFIMRPIRLGLESNGFYPVLEGITVGDHIVTEGSFLLRAEWLKLHPSGS